MRSLIAGIAIAVLLTACGEPSSPSEEKQVTYTTGNPYLDRDLGNLRNELNAYFGVNVRLHLDRTDIVNALSYPTGDVRLFQGMIREGTDSRLSWPFLVLVLGHEWAHQLQFQEYGSQFRYSIQRELQADCIGAYFLFTHRNVNRDELGTLIHRKVPIVADPQGVPWWNPAAHGTSHQRTEAIKRGYNASRQRSLRGGLFSPWEMYQACRY